MEVLVSEGEFDQLLEELRCDELEKAPEKAFDWGRYVADLRLYSH